MKQGAAIVTDGAMVGHIDLNGLYFINGNGYLTLNCCKCGDPESGTLIAFVEGGDTPLELLWKACQHVCEVVS